MTHVRQQIRDAIASALAGISGVTIKTNRTRPLDDYDLPVIEVRTPEEEIERLDKQGRLDRRLTVQVIVRTNGDEADNAADIWSADVETVLYADGSVAALLNDDLMLDRVDAEWNDETSAVHLALTMSWTARYSTAEDDPSVAA